MPHDTIVKLDAEAKERLLTSSIDKEESYPVTDLVLELERRFAEAEKLLNQIIASLNLEGNAQWFEEMPESWHDLVGHWTKRHQAWNKLS